MADNIDISSALESIREQLHKLRHEVAFAEFRELLCSRSKQSLIESEEILRAVIGSFFKRKGKALTEILERRLNDEEYAQNVLLADVEVSQFLQETRRELAELSNHHIFQWKTYYREYFGTLYDRLYLEADNNLLGKLLAIATKEIADHSLDIFLKGYRHFSYSKGAGVDALSKSTSGLQSFLSIPIEIYSTLAFKIKTGNDAFRLRRVCSALLEGIFAGYGVAKFGNHNGWGVLPRFPRAWVHSTAFLDSESCKRIAEQIEPGEFQAGMIGTVVPVVAAIDRLMQSQSGEDFCLPRLGQFAWGSRRLEISLSLPNAVADTRYLEIHCYFSSGFLDRNALEESANRATNLIAGQLRPDLKEWVEAHDILRTTFVDTDGADTSTNISRGLEVLNHELAKYMGTTGRAEPITLNLARTFPLQNPFIARYFIVQRKSVRDLLRTFERDTGVRLWCSVRRSGKTTACFDLGAASENAIVVNQTMEHTEQYIDANVFSSAFSTALDSGRQLSDNFVRETVAACAGNSRCEGRKVIFVLDEYETLFQRMALAVNRDRELRYTVVQPILNQLVGFSRENLIIFIGQRPDSHYILMDQNQLSPYVKQDRFPLFEHTSGRNATEFTELIRKVLTERVGFDMEFADAVYAETGGHPYLTVNILTDFFQWMIDEKRRAGDLNLKRIDFENFTLQRLTSDRLRRSGEYDFFRNAIMSALSEETREHDPWLYAIYRVLQTIAQENPVGFEFAMAKFDEVTESLLSNTLGWDSSYFLSTAVKANFLQSGDVVRPTIRILARLAGLTKARC